ncbi:MAG: hypothetical protein Q9164_005045, partial [Protoblastenia rupestris]
MTDIKSPKSKTSIVDLPADVFYAIFPYLSVLDYLNLTTCTPSLIFYRQDPTYWHTLTRQTFRIPEQPLLQGHRWQWLYKKLLTQTRLYTWGSNKQGNLGHEIPPAPRVNRRQYSHWPRQPEMKIDVGIISDVQCGGWSTTLLNSIGQVYIFGIFDGLGFRGRVSHQLRLLGFPPGYPPTTRERYEPSTAIKQYSTGRSSVLGLSDDGKVWSWTDDVAVLVKSVHVDLVENKVIEVQTGWDRSSMYVHNIGIVYWSSDSDSDLLRGGRQQALEVADAILVDTVTIPGTGFRQRNARFVEDNISARIGEVTHYVVLEAHIVFITRLNKVFSYASTFPMSPTLKPEPVELTSFYHVQPAPFGVRDIQGSFRNFAIFTTSGAILTGSRNMLDTYHQITTENAENIPPNTLPQPILLPSLHSGTVISLAFGDHHLHALHNNGTITSLGTECQRCGALGLGAVSESTFRGVHSSQQDFGDANIPSETPKQHTVWFEPLMEEWLRHMSNKIKDPMTGSAESQARAVLMRNHDPDTIEAMGDYFETKGRKWEDGVTTATTTTTTIADAGESEGEMPGYFVLKVAAAGWHSAALVLVDDIKVERARENHIIRPSSLTHHNTNTDEGQPESEPSLKSNAPSIASNETIESPTDQLVNAITSAFNWFWALGRRFLGLVRRDELREEALRRE